MKKQIAGIFLTATLAAAGCSVHGVNHEAGNPLNEESIRGIVNSKTTTTDIIGLFGAPTSTSTAGTEELYIYKHCKTGGTGFSIAGIGSSSTKESCNILTISFEKATGLVKSHNYKKMFD